jgi:hypothetical protein
MRARAILSSYLQRSLTLSRFPTKLFIPPAYDGNNILDTHGIIYSP